MVNCYHCGAKIESGEGYRRQVLTSQSARIYFSKRSGGSYGQSYGLRTLCASCALRLDEHYKNLAWKVPVSLAVSLIGMVMAVRVRDSFNGGIPGLMFIFFAFGGAGLLAYWILGLVWDRTPERDSSTRPDLDGSGYLVSTASSVRNEDKPEVIASNSTQAELMPYIDTLRAVGLKVESLGLAYFGVFGLETTEENLYSFAKLIFKILPPRHERDVTAWGESLYRLTCQRFLNEFSAATNPINLDLMLLIFPGRPPESSDEYLHRLHIAAEMAIAVVNSDSEISIT